MEFIENYPVEKLIPTKYNPRKIEDEVFEKLTESINKFGIIKPIIINGENGILTAGHQRTKAIKSLGIETVPVIKLPDIVKSDEIMFNLFHNSIETNRSDVRITDISGSEFGYSFVVPGRISFEKNLNPVIVKEIGILIMKYGCWGNVVCDENGRILLNSEYAIACKLLDKPILVFKIENKKVSDLLKYLNLDYGEYDFDTLGIKDYNQTYCQMNRLGGKKPLRSTTYTKFVLPILQKPHRVLDFGAGKCAYSRELRKQGYKFSMYEPFYREKGKNAFKIDSIINFIKEIEADISQNGLYDIVILDSVLNSITNIEMQHNVLLACNALLKDHGTLIIGTRSLGKINCVKNSNISTDLKRDIEFLDKENFSVTFRSGVWTKQKFHTKETLHNALKPYFEEITIYDAESRSNIYAICKKPIRWDLVEYKKALDIEFNMTYPKGFKHNQHEELIAAVSKEH
jgi:hypothetical protein